MWNRMRRLLQSKPTRYNFEETRLNGYGLLTPSARRSMWPSMPQRQAPLRSFWLTKKTLSPSDKILWKWSLVGHRNPARKSKQTRNPRPQPPTTSPLLRIRNRPKMIPSPSQTAQPLLRHLTRRSQSHQSKRANQSRPGRSPRTKIPRRPHPRGQRNPNLRDLPANTRTVVGRRDGYSNSSRPRTAG